MSTESIDPRFANYQRTPELQSRVDAMPRVSPDEQQAGRKVAVVTGSWHGYIVDALLEGALDALNERGIADENITLVEAPGAFEMPLVFKKLAETQRFAAVIVLGTVIKGETPHFDYVAGECARGLADVSREFNLPVGFGVLTVNTVEQALARAQKGEANKGREAVMAALDTASLVEKMS